MERERINKQTILIHQSAQIEYSENGFLIIKAPKMYKKQYFSPEQWAELEKVLNQKNSTTENQSPTGLILTFLGSIVLITGVIILLTYYLNKRKRTKK